MVFLKMEIRIKSPGMAKIKGQLFLPLKIIIHTMDLFIDFLLYFIQMQNGAFSNKGKKYSTYFCAFHQEEKGLSETK